MRRSYRKFKTVKDGWSDWVAPKLDRPFKFACCDCGLVHDMELRIAPDGKPDFRARVNRRSTGQLRRRMRERGELR